VEQGSAVQCGRTRHAEPRTAVQFRNYLHRWGRRENLQEQWELIFRRITVTTSLRILSVLFNYTAYIRGLLLTSWQLFFFYQKRGNAGNGACACKGYHQMREPSVGGKQATRAFITITLSQIIAENLVDVSDVCLPVRCIRYV
jgi:hypothetical protein